jgi:D-lactate dehydrogenase
MARQPVDSPVFKRLQQDYEYDAIETCAGDGTCSLRCPIGINTGSLMRSFRKLERTEEAESIALRVAQNWAVVERASRIGLSAASIVQKIVGVGPLRMLTGAARAVVSSDLIPTVPGPMPKSAAALPTTHREGAAAVYFPACINRMFGRDPDASDNTGLPEALVRLSARAGRPLWIPKGVVGLCCATPFSSKGYALAHDYMAARIADAFWEWSQGGELPVVIDAASCTHGIVEDVAKHVEANAAARFAKIRVIDAVTWCEDLLPALSIRKKLDRVILHPTCSMMHLHLINGLEAIAAHLAVEVEIPFGAACCGTAGDRGLLHPELVLSATREERASVKAASADAYLSSNRTCEMGMRHATGMPYESFVYLLDELSQPA